MTSKRNFVISKTALKMVILPMAIFGYQQYLVGNVAAAAGAGTIVVATLLYELRYDLKQVPFDAEGLENAARRIGSVEEDVADAINDRVNRNDN